jgi:hypothetical protein
VGFDEVYDDDEVVEENGDVILFLPLDEEAHP